MDINMDHALVCPRKGDRTLRHNALRNTLFNLASMASLRPEKEKAGLLPDRPQSDELHLGHCGRRPADIWLPQGASGGGEAWDFAATSGMQPALFRPAVDEPGLVF